MPSDYEQIRTDNILEYGQGTRHLSFLGRLYTDRTHFVFELLQNAEDAGATRILFTLFEDKLEVTHNGRPFNELDVRGVCGVGEGTKAEDLTQIGKFGIGFKSVYAYTSTPEVHSGNESFRIENYVRPFPVETRSAGNSLTTLFVFTFDAVGIDPETACREISDRLRNLSARTLLFLRKINQIEYKLTDLTDGVYLREEVVRGSARQVTVIGQNNGMDEDENWLIFERSVPVPDGSNQVRVEIGFRLEPSTKDKPEGITKIKDAQLVVYFPTEKDTRFGFLIQGPYRTTPSRDNIPKKDDWNKTLVRETANLLLDVLPNLKKLGLLTITLLEALPIRMDDFTEDSMFYPIVVAVREALMYQDLLPADDGTFVSAQNAKLASAEWLRKLLQEEQLKQLFKTEVPLRWISGEITERAKYDLWKFTREELKVEEVTPDSFARKITQSLLTSQTDDWFIEFYGYLTGQEALWRSPRWVGDTGGILRTKPILRLQDDGLTEPFLSDGTTQKAFLPPPEETDFRIVKRTIVSNEQVVNFLKRLGLSEPDVFDDIVEKVLPKYRKPDTSEITLQDYKSDIQKILRALKSDSESGKKKVIEAAKWTPFLKSIDQNNRESYKKPIEIYSDSQVLREYFQREHNTWFLKIDIEGLNDPSLFHLLGIANSPRIIQTNSKGHSECKLEHSNWKEEYVNYEIEGLDSRMASLTALPFDEVKKFSLILWNFIKNYFDTDRERFSGQYKWYYYSWKSKKIESSFLSLLKKSSWIPTRDYRIAMPMDVSIDQLFDEYVVFKELIDILGIKQQVMSQTISTEEEKKLEHASELGVSLEDIQFLKRHPEEFEQWKAVMAAQKEKPIFPTRTVLNSERRQEQLAVQLADAPEKEYEKHVISVRTTRGLIDSQLWLKEQYTNDAGQIVCQICQEEMPFRKRDGEYYFEAVEALSRDYFRKEHEAQFLALCPVCAAMYKEFVKHPEGTSIMKDLHLALMNSEKPEVSLKLGDAETSIQFVETHWEDIRTILREMS